MEDERMEITSKDRMWQCGVCSAHYPSELTPVLALHLQWHIERSPDQEPGHHVCPGRKKKSAGRYRNPCRATFDTAEGMAHHILEVHTKKRWCSTEKTKYKEAMRDSMEEKGRLIQKLSTEPITPGRAFLPAHQWKQEFQEAPRLA